MNLYFILAITMKLFAPKPNNLVINLEGISNTKGNIRCALYRSSDKFPDEKNNFKYKVVSAKNSQLIFENLNTDTYALAVFHDENKNGILDKNIFGVPTEKYGFSNNARGVFSAPSFKEAAVNLKSDKTISIFLK
ncbi:MAG: DUF2141 domain-containing protein [Flavobacteriia bacterium]|jgi:uncharacterized protein (DUF2141 family)